MKINADAQLNTIDGQPIMRGDEQPATVGFACVDALLTPMEGDDQQPGFKARCYHLARALTVGGEVDLAVEDIAMIKGRVERCHPPLVVGQVWEALEGR